MNIYKLVCSEIHMRLYPKSVKLYNLLAAIIILNIYNFPITSLTLPKNYKMDRCLIIIERFRKRSKALSSTTAVLCQDIELIQL